MAYLYSLTDAIGKVVADEKFECPSELANYIARATSKAVAEGYVVRSTANSFVATKGEKVYQAVYSRCDTTAAVSFAFVDMKARSIRIDSAPCPKCNGRGYMGEYSHVKGGVCFRCKGSGLR